MNTWNFPDDECCKHCKSKLPSYAKYCGVCGTRLDFASTPTPLGEPAESALLVTTTMVPDTSTTLSWGWLPALSLTSATGILLIALAGNAGRVASQWADPLFWLGLLVLFVPIALRILSSKSQRWERIALLVVLGNSLYLIRVLNYPLSFAYNDEFLHWRGAQDIALSGHLFTANPLLPVGPYFPGLEILTNALSSLTGLSIFISGMIVLSTAGLLLILSLYLFFEYLSRSARIAALATLLFMANPGFFSLTQFVYESLAIPLSAFVLFMVLRRNYMPKGQRKGLTLMIWLGLAAVVITHHVTSYVLVAFLLLWTMTSFLSRIVAFFHFIYHPDKRVRIGPNPGGAAFLGLLLCVIWLVYTGDVIVGYLGPYIGTTLNQLKLILANEGASRQFFHDSSGFVEPLWERVIAFTSVALISLGLLFGVLQIWRHYRTNALALAVAIGALAYPFSQAIRISATGATLGARAVPYLFVMVAFVLAVSITHFRSSHLANWRNSLMVMTAIVIICVGGWVTGTSPLWSRLPGPFLISGDQRSINPETVSAAEWAFTYLGPGHRMIGDRDTMVFMATLGYQWDVTSVNQHILISNVFITPDFGTDVKTTLGRGIVQYIVVDSRLITGLPKVGFYYDVSEPNAMHYTTPIDPADLTKFEGVLNVNRIFDSGNIIIYDISAYS
jgi:hypothetical protein